MIPYTWLAEATERIAAHIHKTPLTYDPNEDIYLKWENHQVTGSFKARGALNKVFSLEQWERQKGLVTASAGNHGQGLALAGQITGAKVIVFASENATPAKLDAMRTLGAELRLVPGGYREAELAGKAFAQKTGAFWISPYNDGQVIAGQGTLGLELLSELPPLPTSAWVCPVGGGGLIAGIGSALAAHTTLETSLVGVQSEASPFFYEIFHRGTQAGATELPSIADGLAGPVEDGSITIPLVRRYVNDFVLVGEKDIAEAVAYAWERYGERIEGSAAASLAAILTGVVSRRPAVAILSGGNIQPELHAEVVARQNQD